MATLPPEISASIDLLRNQCLAIIHFATNTESKLFTVFGETTETQGVLSELKTFAQEATDALSRFNSLQLKVAMTQPEISLALARLISDSRARIEMRIPAWQRSIEEIILTWRLAE